MRLWRWFWLVVCVVVVGASGHSENSGEHDGEKAHAEKPAKKSGKKKAEKQGHGSEHGEKPEAASDDESASPVDDILILPLYKPPYQQVQQLEVYQDRLTRGDHEAHTFQKTLISDIAEQFSKMPDGIWRQPRNARAAVTYVLSGGDPQFLKQLGTLGDLGGGVDATVIKGLIAFSKARNKDAFNLLSKIQASSLGTSAGGHLALAQAMVSVDDPKKALAYIDQARLMAPGTLVEEAALRRGVIMAAKAGDADKFMLFVAQYMWRYNKSVYASNFLYGFAQSFASGKFGTDPEMRKRMETLLDHLSESRQKAGYTALAEAAVLAGRVELAHMASSKLVALYKGDPTMEQRAKLYVAAASVVTEDHDKAVAELKTLDEGQLSARDKELRRAALNLAEQIHLPPIVEGTETAPISVTQAEHDEMKDMPVAVVAGRKSIALADELLNGAGK